MKRALSLLFFVGVLSLVNGCKSRSSAAQAIDASVALSVRDEATGLMFTFVDDKGDFHVVEKASDVPEASRETVRVMDPTKDDPSPDTVMVANLRTKKSDGTYPVIAMSRAEFDKMALERRKQNGPTLATVPSAAPSGSSPSSAHAAAGPIIIYGASWCGACHEAAAYLKSRNIPFIEKDIETDSSAQREMNAKIARAGVRGGSIPIIDVRGKIIQGFSAQAIEQALKG